MIYVKLLEQTEPLNHIQGLAIEKEINGNFQLSLTTFNKENNPGYSLLQEESKIVVEDYEFRVKQMRENRFSKSITAINTFFDLNDERKDDMFAGTKSFVELATWLFEGTEWTMTTDIDERKYVPNFGNDNIIALVNTLCSVFECDYEILPNKTVHFSKQIGANNDYQYRYKHNIKTLNKTVDTSNVKTFIEGYGANGLYVSYTSPLADNPLFGIRKADPVHDDRFTHANSLLEYIKTKLNDVPAVAMELDVAELTARELGETIWLIYEPMNIELSTRIMKQTLGIVDGHLITKSVVLGNVLPKSTQDLLIQQKIEIDDSRKEYRSKIEQTNERISLEVEALDSQIAQLNIRADNIELSVVDLENNLSSKINQTANEIRTEVQAEITTINGEITSLNNNVSTLIQRADVIQSTVTSHTTEISSLGTRMTSAESNIIQLSNEIDLRVSYDDYTGNQIISRINLAPGYATIQASKINLVGAVSVLSDISGNLGSIYAGNIYSANIDITESISIGKSIYMRGNGTGVYFDTWSQIYDYDGNMTIEAFNDINYSGRRHYFYGEVNFSNAVVSGITVNSATYATYASYLGGYSSSDFALGHTSGIGIAYSSAAGRLYVRLYGSNVGWVQLNTG